MVSNDTEVPLVLKNVTNIDENKTKLKFKAKLNILNSVVIYWKEDENNIRIFERKSIRLIYGPTYEFGI